MNCKNCGNKIEKGMLNCNLCGMGINSNNMEQAIITTPKRKNNIVPIIIFIFIFFLVIGYIGSEEVYSNPAVGTWNCKSFYSSYTNEDSEFVVTFKLDNNNNFLWGKYDDIVNNHVIGYYTFTDLEKTNNSGDYKYYNIKVNGEEFVDGGKLQTEPYVSEYEMGINEEANEAILMNVKTYNMYYCYRSSEENPVITKSY